MKAFLGALVLSLLAAAAGVLAASELHRINLDAKVASTTPHQGQIDNTEPIDPAGKQRVMYRPQTPRLAQPKPSERL